jgi:pathogenesis-related protein 1
MRRLGLVSVLLAGAAAAEEPPAFTGVVEAHNTVRAAVGVPPLRWSAELAGGADDWARRLAGENACRLRHSDSRDYGENLAWYYNVAPDPAAVVRDWAGERQWYDHATGACLPGKQCGHYTQVVWKDTQWVGCGKASCGAEEVWVCRYAPPGNLIGRKPY